MLCMVGCAPDGIHLEWQVLAGTDPVACGDLAMPATVEASASDLLGRHDATFACEDGEGTFEPALVDGETTTWNVTADLIARDATFLDRGLELPIMHEGGTRTDAPAFTFQVAGPVLVSWHITSAQNGDVGCGVAGAATVRVVIADASKDFACGDTMGELAPVVFGAYEVDASLLRADGSVLAQVSQPNVLARGSAGLTTGFGFDVP